MAPEDLARECGKQNVVNLLRGPTNPLSEMPKEPFVKERDGATVEFETTPIQVPGLLAPVVT